MEYTIVYLKPSNIFTKYLHRVHLDDKVMHPKQGNITQEYQKGSKNSVSAQVVAFLAVVTLIKDCYKIQKSHSKQTIFSHFMGPTGLLNTKVH